MPPTHPCGVCGTVNVLPSARCIACGQPLPGGRATPPQDDVQTATTGTGADAVADATSQPAADLDRTEPVAVPAGAAVVAATRPVSAASSVTVRAPAAAAAASAPAQAAHGPVSATVPIGPPMQLPPAPPPAPTPAPVRVVAVPVKAPALPPHPSSSTGTAAPPSSSAAASKPVPAAPVSAAPSIPAPPPAAARGAASASASGSASASATGRTMAEPAAARSATGDAPRAAPAPPSRPVPEAALPPRSDDDDEVRRRAPDRTVAATPAEAPRAAAGVAFVVRLLLPEGDKRLVEIGAEPARVGSGLDEIGLAGDPRIGVSEGTLSVEEGRLWIDVAPHSTGVYLRIDAEETLRDGDVVLVGDIAAEFRGVPASPPLVPEAHVLGGGSATPCGRLVFLRKDGSPGPVHDLPAGKTILGRTDGHLNFPQDSRLSRRHVRFYAAEDRVTVEDLDSRNGTYLRIRGRRRLEVGDALRIGSAGVQIRGRS